MHRHRRARAGGGGVMDNFDVMEVNAMQRERIVELEAREAKLREVPK